MAELDNKRRELFAREYVVDFDGAAAARRAGYSERSAHVTASRILSDAKAQERIAELSGEAVERNDITVDWILERLRPEALNAATDGARVRALELLGKYHAIFVDRQKVDANEETTIEELLDYIAKAHGWDPELLHRAVSGDLPLH